MIIQDEADRLIRPWASLLWVGRFSKAGTQALHRPLEKKTREGERKHSWPEAPLFLYDKEPTEKLGMPG